MATFYTAQAIDITITVLDRADAAATPSAYTFTWEDPSGNQDTETEADVAGIITVVSTGIIRLELAGSVIDEVGLWKFAFEGTTPDVVDSGTFRVIAQEQDK